MNGGAALCTSEVIDAPPSAGDRRCGDGAKRLGDVVTWRWEGVSPDGEALGAGLDFVILTADGRIATDYQFVE